MTTIKSLDQLKALVNDEPREFRLALRGGAFTTRTIHTEGPRVVVEYMGVFQSHRSWKAFEKFESFFCSGFAAGAVAAV